MPRCSRVSTVAYHSPPHLAPVFETIYLGSCFQLVIVLMYLRLAMLEESLIRFLVFLLVDYTPNHPPEERQPKDSWSQITIVSKSDFKKQNQLQSKLVKKISSRIKTLPIRTSSTGIQHFRLCCLVAKNFSAFNFDNPYVKVEQVTWGISTKDSAGGGWFHHSTIEDGKGMFLESESQWTWFPNKSFPM